VSTPDYEERNALQYVVYDLKPLTRAALAAHLSGENWFDLRGSTRASLQGAMDWPTPYANGDKTHEEFVHLRVKFDYQGWGARLSGYSGAWDPEPSSKLYAMATILNPKYAAMSRRLKPLGGWMAACWDR